MWMFWEFIVSYNGKFPKPRARYYHGNKAIIAKINLRDALDHPLQKSGDGGGDVVPQKVEAAMQE